VDGDAREARDGTYVTERSEVDGGAKRCDDLFVKQKSRREPSEARDDVVRVSITGLLVNIFSVSNSLIGSRNLSPF
jgi:hypothetical protein